METIDRIENNTASTSSPTLPIGQQLSPLSNQIKWYKKLHFILPILGGVLLLTITASLLIGVFGLDYENLWDVIRLHRIPRTVAAIVAGAGMSVSGVIMQTITNNKYVSPMTAGTLDSARLGVLLSIMIVPSMVFLSPGAVFAVQGVFSFVITMALTMLFIFFVERIKVKSSALIPLIGIIYGSVIGSVATVIALQSDGGIQHLTNLLMGGFSLTVTGTYETILIAIPFVAAAFIFANWFMLAGMGEGASKNLGLNYRLTVIIGLIIVAIISTLVLLVAGLIPFLGLVIPNLVSIYMGDNIKRSLPVTMLVGGIFLLICDIISRMLIWPHEVPISLTVGVLGAVLFLTLLLVKRRGGSA